MGVAFGTSGLRGPVDAFTPVTTAAYVRAFLELPDVRHGERMVFVGMDLRSSSPRIAADCLAAASDAGWRGVFCGAVPTPALAGFAMARFCPSIMVTGSHIPDSHNGIKFYRADGELLKDDEDPIRDAAEAHARHTPVAAQPLPPPDAAAALHYHQRFVASFPPGALKGLRVGVYLHSAVGRDLLLSILSDLGADCHPFGRAETFLPVDTEAVSKGMLATAREAISQRNLHAVVSTDGDGDRPLLIDETGNQINGDVLGALAARALNLSTIVTPLTSTSAIELSGWFTDVRRTRIGSPFVVAEMAQCPKGAAVAGFEANGGFLLGTGLDLAGGHLTALPTRDAVLPLIAVLKTLRDKGTSLSALAAELPPRIMLADRLQEVPSADGARLLRAVREHPDIREQILGGLAEPVEIDITDGNRFRLADGVVVHLRQSGNAPELRCYVETDRRSTTQELLKLIMTRLETCLRDIEEGPK